jgi:S-formylglutathione hydrolase FrmB
LPRRSVLVVGSIFDLFRITGISAQSWARKKDHADRWNDLIVLNQAKQLKDGDLAISIDCGVYDLFIAGNRALHQELLDQKVMHVYTERPGYHGWPYWANAIPYQMLYVSTRFIQADAKK